MYPVIGTRRVAESQTFEVDEFYVDDENPMYVQRWRTGGAASRPEASLVLVHGGAHTGICWTTCPDGRPGWAKLFAAAGWTAYVIDWPGMGRSPRRPDFVELGARPMIGSIASLLEDLGTAVVIAHSMGVPLAAKAIEVGGESAAAMIAVAPSAPGNVERVRPLAPVDRPLVMEPEWIDRNFMNADRFPSAGAEDYRRSLTDMSPTVFNAMGDVDGSKNLVIYDVAKIERLPTLVVASEQDALTPPSGSVRVAEFLRSDYVLADEDWGLEGFGHMMPIELGTEQIVERLLEWLANKGLRSGGPAVSE